MTRVYFSPDVTPEETLRYLPMIGPESHRAVLEMAVPEVRWSVRRRRRRLWSSVAPRTQCFQSRCCISSPRHMASAGAYRVEGAGHMLMLDPRWEGIAEHMLAWLAALTESPRQTA